MPTYHNGGSGTAAVRNPFLYRGYYFDFDLKFYYLNSRYYDPAIARFINADNETVVTVSPEALTDKNLFAYCDNNPVTRKDNGGQFWHIAIGATIGASASIATKLVINAITKEKLTKGLVTAGVAGAFSGGLAASGVGLVGQIVGNTLISMANNAADQAIDIISGVSSNGFDVNSLLIDGAFGAVAGLAGGKGAGSKSLTNIGITNVKRAVNAFAHKGAKEAANVLGKGLVYFAKNAKHMAKPFMEAICKSSASLIINNTIVRGLIEK